MKTAMLVAIARGRTLRPAVAALLVAALTPWSASAVNPPGMDDTGKNGATALSPATSVTEDPYLAYLEALDGRSAAVRKHSVALRTLLREREDAARRFATAGTSTRAEAIAAELQEIDRAIEATESALNLALGNTTPEDGPFYVAPAPLDLERLRAFARRRRRPIDLPVPEPKPIPALPAPAGESLYLEYLKSRAGTSAFAAGLVDDVSWMLRERRVLAYRNLHAPAAERAALEAAIAAVSQRLRATARAAASAAVVRQW